MRLALGECQQSFAKPTLPVRIVRIGYDDDRKVAPVWKLPDCSDFMPCRAPGLGVFAISWANNADRSRLSKPWQPLNERLGARRKRDGVESIDFKLALRGLADFCFQVLVGQSAP
jgi:hypothetical protein